MAEETVTDAAAAPAAAAAEAPAAEAANAKAAPKAAKASQAPAAQTAAAPPVGTGAQILSMLRIGIAGAAKHLPPASVGRPYSGKLVVSDPAATFRPQALPGGLQLAKDGTISGTPIDIGPHRFEVEASHPDGRRVYFSAAVTAQRPIKGAAPAGAGQLFTADQVEAMIARGIEKALAARGLGADDEAA